MTDFTRPPRLELPGGIYHVINRGNYDRAVFGPDAAAELFEHTLAEAASRHRWRISAYVVMPDHFHLVLTTPEANLGAGMKWLQGTWTRRANRTLGLRGRPFQGRFKSIVVEPGPLHVELCDHVHLNPVRAGLVPPNAPDAHRRGSLWRFRHEQPPPPWLDGSGILATHHLADTPAGWRAYTDHLATLHADPEARATLAARRFSRGWCIGSPDFRTTMRSALHVRLGSWRERSLAGLDPDVRQAEREHHWETTLVDLARRAGVELTSLSGRKSAPAKVLLAAALKTTTSAANGWIARRLGMGQPASVSQFTRRWLADPDRRREVDALLAGAPLASTPGISRAEPAADKLRLPPPAEPTDDTQIVIGPEFD